MNNLCRLIRYISPKLKCVHSVHPRLGWVCFFIRFVEMSQQWMLCSEWVTAEHPLTHSGGTHSLQSIHWLSFWRHPFTAEHPLALILTAPIHCRASIDSHSDGTHSLQSIHWLSFWRHPFTAEYLLLRHFYKPDEETNSS